MVYVIVPIGKCGISKYPTILEPQVKVAKPFFSFVCLVIVKNWKEVAISTGYATDIKQVYGCWVGNIYDLNFMNLWLQAMFLKRYLKEDYNIWGSSVLLNSVRRDLGTFYTCVPDSYIVAAAYKKSTLINLRPKFVFSGES